jgi:hypothetical protein
MMNHISDPEKLNTDNNSVYSAEGLRAWASQNIEAGEELFVSYDNCSDCDNIPEDWSTTEILRDFGFVELYPRKFNFAGAAEQQILVAVDEYDHDGKTITYIDWLGYEPPSNEGIAWMKEEHRRLQYLQHKETLAERRHMMPEKEWNTMFQYHQALTSALEAAIRVAIGKLDHADEADYIDAVDYTTFDNIIDDREKENTSDEL